ncbi:MAG: flagellar basal body-associated FliL family protein [Bacteriovoracaceae bacterium]|nr:flagellar basal body-associated FliL family protein [Bacteriovoracaceae bacterium]
MADNEKEAAASGNKSGASTSPIVLVALLINSLGLVAVSFFLFSFVKKESQKPSIVDLVKQEVAAVEDHGGKDESKTKHEATATDGQMIGLEPFTVNLAQGDGPRRYLKLNTVIKFDKDLSKEELEARKPQMRDSIISIINSKRADDLLKREGKLYLKEEIKTSINSYLMTGKVLDVYYVGFHIN